MNESDDRGVAPGRRNFVVVPHRPGPLLSLDTGRSQRARDDLDELIDDLFPDVDERPGWFDAVLVVVGAGLLAWAWTGEPPGVVTVLGVVALALGCILPMRAAWRRARRRREHRRRNGLLEQGVPIDVSSPSAAALVSAYEDLLRLANRSGSEFGDPAISAAHDALREVASLLGPQCRAGGRRDREAMAGGRARVRKGRGSRPSGSWPCGGRSRSSCRRRAPRGGACCCHAGPQCRPCLGRVGSSCRCPAARDGANVDNAGSSRRQRSRNRRSSSDGGRSPTRRGDPVVGAANGQSRGCSRCRRGGAGRGRCSPDREGSEVDRDLADS